MSALNDALAILRDVVRHDGGVRYQSADDDCGDRACCGVAMYEAHALDCHVAHAAALLAAPTPDTAAVDGGDAVLEAIDDYLRDTLGAGLPHDREPLRRILAAMPAPAVGRDAVCPTCGGYPPWEKPCPTCGSAGVIATPPAEAREPVGVVPKLRELERECDARHTDFHKGKAAGLRAAIGEIEMAAQPQATPRSTTLRPARIAARCSAS